jgi:hypothetical protein
VSAWWTDIIEERFCLCGAARQETFPYGTRPLVRRRHFAAWEAEHTGEGHGRIGLNAWQAARISRAWERTMTLEGLLDSALEHGSHAWRALEVAGLAEDTPDGPWPPNTKQPVGSAAYHLAAMLDYIKRAYDKAAQLHVEEHAT